MVKIIKKKRKKKQEVEDIEVDVPTEEDYEEEEFHEKLFGKPEYEFEHPEVALLAKILHTGDIATVADEGIDAKFFTASYQRMFITIQDHLLKYGKVPDIDTMAIKYPDVFERSPEIGEYEPSEPTQYYCDQVREIKKEKTLVRGMTASFEMMEEDAEKAHKHIQKVLLDIENDIVKSERQELGKDTDKRIERYKERVRTGGMSGILSGIPSLDRITRGFHKGELSAILGYTGSGKTWALLIIAMYMAKEGYKVLVMTTEMAVAKMMDRIDAIGAGLGYSRFMSGTLTPEEEERYQQFLEEREGDEDFNLIVEQATAGVTQISAKIEQHKPDIVFIDGAYLLENDSATERSSGDDWSSVLRVYRDLHKMCLAKDIPIVTTTQSKERQVDMGNMSFARAISNELDLLIGLEQDQEMWEDKEMRWKILKLRDGEISTKGILTEWNWSEMRYQEIYAEKSNGDADVETRREGFNRNAKKSA